MIRTTTAKERRRRRAAQARGRRIAATYWLTPKAWNKRCWHCGAESSIAVRPGDNRYACAECIERLQIKVGNGKSTTPTPVTVRFECPVCGGPHARSEHSIAA
jgi:hypothetical protein